MQICVHLDSARLNRWHLVLIDALQDAGHDPVVSFSDKPEALPTSLSVVLDYDRARAKTGDERFSAPLDQAAFSGVTRYAGGGYDLMLDLTSANRIETHPGRVVRPLYDGAYKVYALYHCVLQQRSPVLALADSQSRDHIWPIGHPAIETPWRPNSSLDMIYARLMQGIVRTLAAIARGQTAPIERGEQVSFAGRSDILSACTGLALRRASRKAGRALGMITANTPRWHVAWRRCSEPSSSLKDGTTLLDLRDYRVLDDTGRGYFADPFLFVHDNKLHVFVEEVPSDTGRGVISHFELNANGEATTPRIVLDTGSHLSYPFVFAREGQIYMLPEASNSGGLDLYRAIDFPSRWEKVARLLDEPVHDATLFEHGGKLWLFANIAYRQSSTWDGLALFSADTLLGPWQPHPHNPVLIDAAASRPAGPLWQASDGSWMRPAQDCVQGYGAALSIHRITNLHAETFTQTPCARLSFAPASGILGPHTFSRLGGFEIIDLFAAPWPDLEISGPRQRRSTRQKTAR